MKKNMTFSFLLLLSSCVVQASFLPSIRARKKVEPAQAQLAKIKTECSKLRNIVEKLTQDKVDCQKEKAAIKEQCKKLTTMSEKSCELMESEVGQLHSENENLILQIKGLSKKNQEVTKAQQEKDNQLKLLMGRFNNKIKEVGNKQLAIDKLEANVLKLQSQIDIFNKSQLESSALNRDSDDTKESLELDYQKELKLAQQYYQDELKLAQKELDWNKKKAAVAVCGLGLVLLSPKFGY